MPIAAHTPERDREERETATAEREGRIEQRLRVSPQPDYAEADRLAEAASVARIEKERLGGMCWSLMRCRERATEHGYGDVVLAVQPLVDLYQDKLKVATEAYKAAMFESTAFNVRNWQ